MFRLTARRALFVTASLASLIGLAAGTATTTFSAADGARFGDIQKPGHLPVATDGVVFIQKPGH